MRSFSGIVCLFILQTGLASAGLMTLTNNTTGLFDASSGTRTVLIDSLTPGFDTNTITRVAVSIDFVKADGESFAAPYPTGTPFLNETVFSLTGPDGTIVSLIAAGSFKTGSTLFDGVITFSQSAAQIVNVNDVLMQAGTFRPIGNLSGFNGSLAAGTWTLNIQDTTGSDALRFRSFTLEVETGVPEPSSATMIVLGGLLGAVGVWRRRR
jgi:hypothetical protein